MRATAFWIERPGHGSLRPVELPRPGPNDVVLRALYSGISRGTEALVFGGRVPVSQREVMRAPFQEGDFPGPVKYGYSLVGRVEAGPEPLAGKTAFCLHPHQDRAVLDATDVLPVPDTVPPGRAVLAANMETALNATWDAGPRVGDRVAIVGAGTVGCLTAYLVARIPGCSVQLVDVDAGKAEVAAALGVALRAPRDADPDRDLVFHASGTPDGLATALSLAGFEATVVELSWYGDAPVPAPLGEDFHARRLVLRSSQVGHVAPARRARRTRRDRLATAIALLDDPVLDALITGESAFADLPATLARLAARPDGALCHRVVYP